MKILSLATSGVVVGCLLGCTYALVDADQSLERSAVAAAAHEDAALAEARTLLQSIKDPHSGICSESEIADFRARVFNSEYVKDAGRMRKGRIECSAVSGRSVRMAGPFKPDFRMPGGAFAYRNLSPKQASAHSRAAMRLGSSYVVFGVNSFPATGRIRTKVSFTMIGAAAPGSGVPPYMTSEGNGQTGSVLYVTRCSNPAFSCVTAATTVGYALQGDSEVLSLFTFAGGMGGMLCGIGLPFLSLGKRDLGRQLRRALAEDKIEVRYQPIVNLETRKIVGAEALARWTDARGGAVDPEVFVKIAEEQGFLGLITKAVLKRVLRDFGATLRNRPDFRVSINVGAPDLVEPRFLPMLEGALEKARVRPESLVIEITERSAANGEAAKETIRLLRQLGHSIHIDDFGSGFSNLDRLLYLYADTIKIDKAFTRTIDTESVAAVILPHMMKIAKSLNLDVIVEGVELSRQADYFLPGRQKIYGQGWLFGRPMTAEEFLSQLDDSPVQVEASTDGYPVLKGARGALQAAPTLTA